MWQFGLFDWYVQYCGCYMWMTVAVQWDIYMLYDRNICSGAYANNVKCMYTSASGHIVDCREFIWGIYSGIAVSYMHMN